MQIRYWVMALLLLAGPLAQAQGEFNNWFLGNKAGVSFGPAGPRSISGGQMVSGEGCAAISDAQGNLQFYTNGVYAWNRLHRKMANGNNLGAYKDSTRTELPPNSATQGVVAVPRPGSSTEYYIFTVDAAENNLSAGLRYSLVDMTRQGGLGEVTSKNNPVTFTVGPGRLTEKLLAVRHANQRDIWIIVHFWDTNLFASYLLTDTGLAASPVLSAGGTVHRGGRNPRRDYNALGAMKVSRNGRRLATAQYHGELEVFDFNYGTGVVSGPRLLDTTPANTISGFYGLEFSPDGNQVYASIGQEIKQYNLLAGSVTTLSLLVSAWALQLGPDLKIYVAGYFSNTRERRLGVINAPNTTGPGCNYQPNGVTWTDFGQWAVLGLPVVMVRPPVPDDVLLNFSLQATNVCIGQVTQVAASVYPAIPDAVFTWDFGDPAYPNNTATGPTAQHRYPRAGTYTVTMTMQEVSGAVRTYAQLVRVLPPPTARLRALPAGGLCEGTRVQLALTPAQPAGTTYRWSNGSTLPEQQVQLSGPYWVDVTSPQGCTVRDSLSLSFAPLPVVSLGPNQVVCDEPNILLDPGPQLPGSTYSWQDGSTASRYTAVKPGRYAVRVTTPAGCSATGTMDVQFGQNCPFIIPNIITPNGDADNEFFRLKGFESGTWDLKLFNRWGSLIYEQAPYANRWNAAGHADGLYYYLITHRRTGQQYRGWLEVTR